MYFPSIINKKRKVIFRYYKKTRWKKNKEILDTLPNEFKKRFIKESPIEEVYEIITKRTLDYINYLEEEKKKIYEALEKEIKEAKEIEQICFFESGASKNSSRTTTNTPRIQTERRNPEIDFEERKAILDSCIQKKLSKQNLKILTLYIM